MIKLALLKNVVAANVGHSPILQSAHSLMSAFAKAAVIAE
jgi:hypothetical protein